jgi:hypothetical protein
MIMGMVEVAVPHDESWTSSGGEEETGSDEAAQMVDVYVFEISIDGLAGSKHLERIASLGY